MSSELRIYGDKRVGTVYFDLFVDKDDCGTTFSPWLEEHLPMDVKFACSVEGAKLYLEGLQECIKAMEEVE
jgi:hypothetical protein